VGLLGGSHPLQTKLGKSLPRHMAQFARIMGLVMQDSIYNHCTVQICVNLIFLQVKNKHILSTVIVHCPALGWTRTLRIKLLFDYVRPDA
jgi:hypothetical protein